MTIDAGNVAEMLADGISVIALAASIVLPARAEKRDRLFKEAEQAARLQFEREQGEVRREFEKHQVQRIEASEKRVAEFESTLRRTDAVRAKFLDDIKELKVLLGEVFSKFENLLRTSRTAVEDSVLVQACRESLQPLIDLQKGVDRLRFVLERRHERALERFETVLMTMFLDVRRVTEDRNAQYLAQIMEYEKKLEKYEKLAKRFIDDIHRSASLTSEVTVELRGKRGTRQILFVPDEPNSGSNQRGVGS